MINTVNQIFNNLDSPTLAVIPTVEELPESKIRFEVQGVYLHDSSDYYIGTMGDYSRFLNFAVNPECEINIFYFYTANQGGGAAYQNPRFIFMGGSDTTSLPWVGGSYWANMQLLAHELGHTIGLPHTFPGNAGCGDDMFDDTYFPDENRDWKDCGINETYAQCGGGVGISNNIMGYNKCRSYLSPKQIAYARYSLLRNGRNYLKTNYDYSKTIIINNNEIWNESKLINGDLIVKTGNALTIKCKVIIEPGAKLIIDEGLLTSSSTSSCSEEEYYWQNIQVYGTSNKNQFPEHNPTHQGLLVMKNGGIIENAHKAVTNWHQDKWNEIGGVIQVTDGVFRNNRRDVEFMSYQNYTPNYSNKYRNLSYFRNTEFTSNDDFIEKGLPIQTHVTLWEVDGIKFTNCHFSNEVTSDKDNSSAPQRGIYSVNAGYKVGAGCNAPFLPIGQPCPTANLLKSSFKGFNTAIEATGAGTSETVTVQQTDFDDNIWGIVIDEFDNVSVNRNTIEVGEAGYNLFWHIGAGVMIDNSTGYNIEENVVTTNLPSGLRVGININNSGTDDNKMYKNELMDLTIGVSGNGKNHNSNYQKGLQFLCNEFNDNENAISIYSSPNSDGIRFYQGDFSPAKSAGNTFSGNTIDIDNNANSIVYMHNGGNTEPISNQGMITLQSTSNANSCPTSFGGGIIFGPILLALDSLNTQFNNLTTSYNDLNFTYISLIDDGNTEDFKDNIEINWSNDAWLLRGKLLESSPYLSSEVLLEAAKQNVLPNGMLLEILLANPDATRGERFIEALKEVTQNTFPEYMLDYLRGNYDSKTLRTDMEGQLSSIHSELSSTRNWIKHLTKSKEEYNDSDKFDVVKIGNEIYNKVGLMDYYIEQGNFSQADSVLNVIENDKKYKEDLGLINNFGDYIAFRSSLGNRNLAQLDSTEIIYLQTLAENKGRVAGYARNILCFFYDRCYKKDLEYGEPQAKSMMIPSQNNKKELNNVLYNVKIYPNPAKDYTRDRKSVV